MTIKGEKSSLQQSMHRSTFHIAAGPAVIISDFPAVSHCKAASEQRNLLARAYRCLLCGSALRPEENTCRDPGNATKSAENRPSFKLGKTAAGHISPFSGETTDTRAFSWTPKGECALSCVHLMCWHYFWRTCLFYVCLKCACQSLDVDQAAPCSVGFPCSGKSFDLLLLTQTRMSAIIAY
jgi:hypothetical protein